MAPQPVYDSGMVTGTSAAKTVAVNVTGNTQLRLVVTDGGDGNDYDHGDWADAKIPARTAAGDTTPPTVTATDAGGRRDRRGHRAP